MLACVIQAVSRRSCAEPLHEDVAATSTRPLVGAPVRLVRRARLAGTPEQEGTRRLAEDQPELVTGFVEHAVGGVEPPVLALGIGHARARDDLEDRRDGAIGLVAVRELLQPRTERRVAALRERVQQQGKQAPAFSGVGNELDRPLDERARRVEILPLERRSPGGREMPARTRCELCGARVVDFELGAQARRLLEVVADDLLLLVELAVRLEPICEALVQLCAGRLRKRVVGGVSDQEMAKTERVVARDLRAVRSHDLLADEREQIRGDVVVTRFPSECGDGAAMEDLALDRAAIDDRTLALAQRVESCLEERLDRRRHLHGPVGVAGERAPSPR